MTCPKCKKPVAAGDPKCGACGTVVAVPDEIDLMPEEPSKAPSFTAYHEPPGDGPMMPPGPSTATAEPGKKGGRELPLFTSRGAASSKGGPPVRLLVMGGAAAFVVLLLGWLIFRTKSEITGSFDNKKETEYTLSPAQPKLDRYTLVGKARYSYDVSVVDGEVIVGVTKQGPKDRLVAASMKTLPGAFKLKKGESRTFTDTVDSGIHVWFMINNDPKKPAKVKARFKAELD